MTRKIVSPGDLAAAGYAVETDWMGNKILKRKGIGFDGYLDQLDGAVVQEE